MTTQNTSIAKAPEEAITSLYQVLETKYNPEAFNLVLPMKLPNAKALQGKVPEIAVVNLSAHAYKIAGGNTYGITKTGLCMVSEAAGISVNTEIVSLSANYVCVKAIASMSKDGVEHTSKPAHKEYDMEAIKEKLLDEYRTKADKSQNAPEWKEGQVWSYWNNKWSYKGMADDLARRDYLQIKEHKLSLCETKAMNRAIRALLALKTSYTEDELKKPFVIARLKPDWLNLDREQREGMLLAGQKAVGLLTGSQPQTHVALDPATESASSVIVNEDGEILNPEQAGYPVEMPAIDDDDAPIDAEFSTEVPEQPQTIAPPAQPETVPQSTTTENTCSQCGVELEARVVSFCKNRNLPPLCYDHQKK